MLLFQRIEDGKPETYLLQKTLIQLGFIFFSSKPVSVHIHYFNISLPKYSTTTMILQYFVIFYQYIRDFVLKSLQNASHGSLYVAYSSCTHLKTYVLTFTKSKAPGFFTVLLLSVTGSKIRIQPQHYYFRMYSKPFKYFEKGSILSLRED